MSIAKRLREIPYNYTSFSDREIVLRYLGEKSWQLLETLREQRKTGRSARMLFEVLGDMWIVDRNPYIQEDLLNNSKRCKALVTALQHRLQQMHERSKNRAEALELIANMQQAVKKFAQAFFDDAKQRKKIFNKLKKITRADNICFDGLSRVAHATDATDWRVEYPLLVLKPTSEAEILPLIKACIKLGLTIVPRGGGTGYTGGAIPLQRNSVVINTEKLDRLDAVEWINLPGVTEKVATVRAEAGVVTRRVTDLAYEKDLIFAVDPTSQDASTIGGNIAMNAGGKKAVIWGTTLDNLVSWRMITPACEWLEIERINHNLSKIHQQSTVTFKLSRFAADGTTLLSEPELIEVAGNLLRKQGLGKDVTDKFLAGIPGIQKEGCDGFITSACFILHKAPQYIRTVCLEFFGNDLRKAVPAVVEIKDYLEQLPNVLLAGLEHLDQRYLKAVKYNTKANRAQLPKMLLLADISGDDEAAVAQAASSIIRLANMRDAEGFVAVSAEARKRFWLDRSRTAAIAAHTNAFKINEDVVIPLHHLAEYNDGIEYMNIECSLQNKISIVSALENYLQTDISEDIKNADFSDSEEWRAMIAGKKRIALDLLSETKQQWQSYLNNMANDATVFRALQIHQLVVSYKKTIKLPLENLFSGSDFQQLRDKLEDIYRKQLSSRLIIALHMHAGDGNVHTNIPVNSNDYAMLYAAEKLVVRIMALAKSLGGVISGEHGIGITKMAFVEPTALQAFTEYKQRVDPQQTFNRGKLLAGSGLANAYTPSLRLVEQEALILEASELGELNNAIKDCLRCGKCKPVCMTQVPRANLYYSPRDKILATNALIEAFLYEEQTRRGISFQHFDAFNDIADHCTLCHKCATPCPVNIDFGDVSIRMRTILRERGKKKLNLGTRLAMIFLNISAPTTIKLLRTVLMRWGFVGQRWLNTIYQSVVKKPALPAATTGKTPVREQIIHFVKRPLPSDLPSKTTRALLKVEDNKTIAIIRNPHKVDESSEAVFYFPGCGSERLFSNVGLASLAMLYEVGAQVVLPPGYLCCGYPQLAIGDAKQGNQISVNNQVLFHRMANTLNYLDIKTIIVSCGTCIDQLQKYQFNKIFPGARLMDVHEYLLEKGLRAQTSTTTKYLYHDPCHSPMKIHEPSKVASQLMGQEIEKSKFCCGDAGTLSMSRPDIAAQLKFRKEAEIKRGIVKLIGKEIAENDAVKILTSCPACLKGLASYSNSTGIKTTYIVVELAHRLLGKGWQQRFVENTQHGGIERVLL